MKVLSYYAILDIFTPNLFSAQRLWTVIKWVPITTAWRVLRLRMEKLPHDFEGICEYIE